MQPSNAAEQEYKGSCHCRLIEFDIKVDLTHVVTCNCSICSMKGFYVGYTAPSKFIFTKGKESDMTMYQFHKKVIKHYFCPRCGVWSSFCMVVYQSITLLLGVQTHAQGDGVTMVNVRCLEGIEISKIIPSYQCNGKSL